MKKVKSCLKKQIITPEIKIKIVDQINSHSLKYFRKPKYEIAFKTWRHYEYTIFLLIACGDDRRHRCRTAGEPAEEASTEPAGEPAEEAPTSCWRTC